VVQPSESLPVLDAKYQLTRQLGEGGMGAVYEAVHLGTARRVAVKLISAEVLAQKPDLVARFQREAMVTGAIESQYIAQVTDAGVDGSSGSPYMVMELLSGEDVEQAIARLGPLSPDLAMKIAAQACLGLQKAHEQGVIHRDIKPANLYLTRRDGGEVVVKIVDFGIAKIMGDPFASTKGKALTQTGSMLGSPLYMSPEQAYGKKTTDHRTDIWSLGVVLYEVLSGTTPHAHAETMGELIVCSCQQPARLIQEVAPWVPPEIASVVHKALALDPAARFSTAAEMFSAIRASLPHGFSIDESMFAPLTAQTRAIAAPQAMLSSDLRAPSPSMANLPSSVPSSPALLTESVASARSTAFAQTAALVIEPTVRKRGLAPLIIAGGSVAVLGIGVALAMGRSHGASVAAVATTVESAPTPSSPAAASPSDSASAPQAIASATPPIASPSPPPAGSSAAPSNVPPIAPTHARRPAAPAKPGSPPPPPAAKSQAAPIDPSSVR